MSITRDADRPVRLPGTVVEGSVEGLVASRAEPPLRVALNPTAAALWKLCDGETTVAEMVSAVCDLFEVTPAQAEADVTAGIEQMRRAGLVR